MQFELCPYLTFIADNEKDMAGWGIIKTEPCTSQSATNKHVQTCTI